jgi:GNAT superfamily N-acetyltransferase
VSGDLRLVGFEELSATTLRARLLAAEGRFWAGSVLPEHERRARHDPLFFHQLGGFGALARTPDDADAGYLLGLVSIDRLAVVHAIAVDERHRRRGVASRLLERFADLATRAGARAVQAVTVPGDTAVLRLAERCGAHAAHSADHAGPGADRVLLTRSLPLN